MIALKSLADAVFLKRADCNYRKPSRSLRDVAEETGISAATLSRIEREMMPDLETYIKLCRWLDVPLETFVEAAPTQAQGETT